MTKFLVNYFIDFYDTRHSLTRVKTKHFSSTLISHTNTEFYKLIFLSLFLLPSISQLFDNHFEFQKRLYKNTNMECMIQIFNQIDILKIKSYGWLDGNEIDQKWSLWKCDIAFVFVVVFEQKKLIKHLSWYQFRVYFCQNTVKFMWNWILLFRGWKCFVFLHNKIC